MENTKQNKKIGTEIERLNGKIRNGELSNFIHLVAEENELSDEELTALEEFYKNHGEEWYVFNIFQYIDELTENEFFKRYFDYEQFIFDLITADNADILQINNKIVIILFE